ncbi:MAG: CaiB/BaiF CoA-transferase family protein [Pseudomonadota bacterium]
MPGYPLAGLKVLDFSRVLAGPFATRMLSDLGADVLKIEPPEGDVTRLFGLRTENTSGYYVQQNVGKRNVCLDMKAEGARQIVLKLAKQAYLVVENFRPGVMDKFGVGWADLSAVNPKLVMLSISGFGQTGPERGRAAYAPIMHAETGMISRQAETVGGRAADIQWSMADTYSSLHGLVGAFAALRLAEQTGKGQHVDIAMINAMHATDDYAHWALDGAWRKSEESMVWDAPEGEQILVSGDLKWLWHLFSRDGLADPTPEGADLETKIASRRSALAAHFKSFPTFKAFTDKLDEVNLAWGKVRRFGEDAYSEPSIEARGVLVEVEDELGARRRTVQSPYKFSDAEAGLPAGSRAPARGEHNESALNDWLGLSPDEVTGLKDIGVLRSSADDA